MDKRICTIKSKDLLQFFVLFQNLNEIQSKPTSYFTLLHFININISLIVNVYMYYNKSLIKKPVSSFQVYREFLLKYKFDIE